jgi:anti-sigma-K factor RskA
MTTGHEEYDELVAAFALDALDAPQCDAFRSHLASCPECQAALTDFRRVSAGIGLTVPAEAPPAALRARVVAFATAGGPSAIVSSRPAASPARVAAVTRSSGGSGWLAAAAAAVIAVGAGAYAWSLRSEVASLRALVTTVTDSVTQLRGQLASVRLDNARMLHTLDVVNAPDVVKIDLRGQTGAPAATGHAFWSQTRGMAFNADKLPALDKGRVYQLWVIPAGDKAAPVSAGLFSVDAAGKSLALTNVPASELPAPHVVAITVEPFGGSAAPTSSPVLAGQQ